MQGDSILDPPRRRLVVLGLAAIGFYNLLYLAVWLIRGGSPRFGDFFALGTFGVFALTRPLAAIYDPLVLQQFQRAIDPAFTGAYPFLYPPSFLLLVVPLGLVPLAPAWIVWSVGTLVLFQIGALGRRFWSQAGLALLVVPTTLLSIIAGQSSGTHKIALMRDRAQVEAAWVYLLYFPPLVCCPARV